MKQVGWDKNLIYETLLLVIFGQILALKPPKTAGWFQKKCQKRPGFNETFRVVSKNCRKVEMVSLKPVKNCRFQNQPAGMSFLS